ncbi:MAG TPA: hypothetical protein DCL54_00070 [Alphaproteobacteria bacterium]|nr:hypothetical protein [Alphaproteobacteria bacterium]HAJ44960.1 hypothetical protein [Alphaproteobacteria bacterium]
MQRVLSIAGLAVISVDAAFAKVAQEVTFEGNPLWLIGIGLFVLIVVWLLILGTIQTERGDRGRSNPGIFGDLDDQNGGSGS